MQIGKLKRKRWIIIAASAGVLLAVVLLTVGYLNWQSSESEVDPFLRESDSSRVDDDTDETSGEEAEPEAQQPVEENPASTVDPATVATVDIASMGITVSYVRGVPGFDYAVSRTQNGTQYVEFSNTELVGDKCTGDIGIFASIIENPEDGTDSSTVTSTVKLGEDSYGLSLPAATCTDNPDLFAQFQASFKDAFGLLKPLATSTDDAA